MMTVSTLCSHLALIHLSPAQSPAEGASPVGTLQAERCNLRTSFPLISSLERLFILTLIYL